MAHTLTRGRGIASLDLDIAVPLGAAIPRRKPNLRSAAFPGSIVHPQCYLRRATDYALAWRTTLLPTCPRGILSISGCLRDSAQMRRELPSSCGAEQQRRAGITKWRKSPRERAAPAQRPLF